MVSDRYSRQIAVIGQESHNKLRNTHVAIVGCGGLGCVVGSLLARAGMNLTLIDDDRVETSNLPRQELYEPGDEGQSKVERAGQRLLRVNPDIKLSLFPERLSEKNVGDVLKKANIIADCTDNMPSRFMINDYALKTVKPWVYGGVVDAEGRVWAIVPGVTPCLKCMVDCSPSSDDQFAKGVLSTAVSMVGSLQASEVMKLAMGRHTHGLMAIDAWCYKIRYIDVKRFEKCKCHDIQPRQS